MARKRPDPAASPPPAGSSVLPAAQVDDTKPNAASFPIVGVGASAGGLEAFTQLLRAMPPDTGMGFVLVQHLAPTHASNLTEILSRTTRMPVMEVHEEQAVEPDHVYVIPPDRDMVIDKGTLHLLPRPSHGLHRPIDLFLQSLAQDQGHKAIGVILSGTATDGTLGLESIKAEGGITFAQDDTAQQGGMPRSAVAAGCVDFVLSPAGIAAEIARIARHPYVAPEVRPQESTSEPELGNVLRLVKNGTGVDFTHYKSNTLYRRITRRMALHQQEGLKEYVQFLRDNPPEVESLFQDILISVTSFFRNPELFEALKSNILPRLYRGRASTDPLRVWVLGCSTGEEAYSLAISFTEFAEASPQSPPVQIFATDLNGAAIDKARAGLYARTIAQDVSPERLQRFFSEVDGGYRVSKRIREMCVFARHNVLTDPPFSKIDLVSCRNLLIYLEPTLQQRVVPILHYALKPGGFAVLGAAETIASYREMLAVEDVPNKIYTKKAGSGPLTIDLARRSYPKTHADLPDRPGPPRAPVAPAPPDAHKEADRVLLARYAPPGVVVNADMDILSFRGDTAPYLTPAPGKASLNLLKMAREGLIAALRAAFQKARKEKTPVRKPGLNVRSKDGFRDVDLEVIPLKGGSDEEGPFLVLFHEAGRGGEPRTGAGEPKIDAPLATEATAESADLEVTRLVQELAATREYLQSTIERLEVANEELQSANEEVQSSNEELQSINEELETSKEEIQSSNEELATVNDELRNRNLELGRATNDLTNIFSSMQLAIVLVDRDLRVRRFTPLAEKLFSLIPADIGRSITDIKLGLDVPNLESDLTLVIGGAGGWERETLHKGHWFSLRLRPYRALEDQIDGAVIALVDVDALKRAEAFAASIVATVRQPLLVLGADLRVQQANQAFYRTFQVTPEQTEHRLLYDLGNGQWNIPDLRRLVEDILPRSTSLEDYVVDHEFEGIGRKTMLLNGRRLLQPEGIGPEILLAFEDVTESKRLQRALQQRVAELAQAEIRKDEFLAMLAHELRNPLAPLRNAAELLMTPHTGHADRERAHGMIERQIVNMTRLIDDLLDISRITQGKINLRKSLVDLNEILTSAVNSISHQVEARGQALALSLPSEPVYLQADRTRLEQVFANLLVNASKYTGSGGRLSITAGVEGGLKSESEEDTVVVRVADEGIGIAPEALPHVFNLFFQVDQGLDRPSGGLGIGLTLVRSMVELHGGHVEARSAGLGRGTEMIVRLPILKREPEESRQPVILGTSSDGSPKLASRRMLVVDDNVDAADSMALLLRLSGHEVVAAYDGPAALEVAETFEPEIVLIDIGLPVMDGYEVARRMRQHPALKAALLLAITGYGRAQDRREAAVAGFNHHLTKPVSLEELLGVLARNLSQAGDPVSGDTP
jgi:two-component system CheB/CheR fusion protein